MVIGWVFDDEMMVKVLLEDIMFIESFKDYVKKHRKSSGPLFVKQTTFNIDAMLPSN